MGFVSALVGCVGVRLTLIELDAQLYVLRVCSTKTCFRPHWLLVVRGELPARQWHCPCPDSESLL
jgi:hypothetical protein